MQVFFNEKDKSCYKMTKGFSTYFSRLLLKKGIGGADYTDIAFDVVPYILLKRASNY